MEGDRSWMYAHLINKRLNPDFFLGVTSFLDYAFSVPSNIIDSNCIRCPCAVCCNYKWFDRSIVEHHLNTKGFRPLYQTWYMHGEQFPDDLIHDAPSNLEENVEDDEPNEFVQMVLDAAGHEFSTHAAEESPNPQAQAFYDMLKAADEPIWDGCKKEHTRLACVAELLTIKSDCNITIGGFNRIISAIKKWLPTNKLPPDYYQCRKLVKDLGMGYEKFDACPNDCMLYYGNNLEKDKCDVCQHPRFKNEGEGKKSKRIPHKVLPYIPITPRLRRLFICPTSAEQMRWHKDGVREKEGVMVHPADGQAWKEFDHKNPDFAAESRNVRLGLCADGFSPFNIGRRPYTCWPVFIVCYNLPPGLVMQSQHIFMCLLIPGPNSPGKSIDIYLKPLVDELNSLWINGIEVYDSFRKENFTLKAALMWTINDFPAYAMLSGWSTKGRLGCPVCMEDTKAFQLKSGGKVCYFDCHKRFLCEDHPFRFQSDSFKKDTIETDPPPRRLSGEEIHARVISLGDVTFGKGANEDRLRSFGVEHNWLKKSIFWELPYWPDLLVRHFIDVMHLEMNFFKNVFFTIMDIKDKTKDNVKAREDMAELCARAFLELWTNEAGRMMKPRAPYCLNREQKRQICEWVKNLQFPDGYASNLSNIVNVQDCSFIGLKTHDCHVFIERLLPAALRDFIPDDIWEVIVEVSNFFRDICARRQERPSHVRPKSVATHYLRPLLVYLRPIWRSQIP